MFMKFGRVLFFRQSCINRFRQKSQIFVTISFTEFLTTSRYHVPVSLLFIARVADLEKIYSIKKSN